MRLEYFFLDDFSFNLTPKDIAKVLKKKGRYVRLIYFVGENFSEVDVLRPLFELNSFKMGAPDFVTAQYLGYSEYFFVLFNCSVPNLLYRETERSLARKMYGKIFRAFDIRTKHFAIYSGSERVPEKINQWEFVSLLTNKKFYARKFKSLDAFITYTNKAPDIESDLDAYVEIHELRITNRSKI